MKTVSFLTPKTAGISNVLTMFWKSFYNVNYNLNVICSTHYISKATAQWIRTNFQTVLQSFWHFHNIMNREKAIVLAEVVRGYPNLYEKPCTDYHRRDI